MSMIEGTHPRYIPVLVAPRRGLRIERLMADGHNETPEYLFLVVRLSKDSKYVSRNIHRAECGVDSLGRLLRGTVDATPDDRPFVLFS